MHFKEPAFSRVIVVWKDTSNTSKVALEVRAYRDVPIANLEQSYRPREPFRPADALRLDLVSIASIISAFFVTARYTTLPTRLVASVAVGSNAPIDPRILQRPRTVRPAHGALSRQKLGAAVLSPSLDCPRAAGQRALRDQPAPRLAALRGSQTLDDIERASSSILVLGRKT